MAVTEAGSSTETPQMNRPVREWPAWHDALAGYKKSNAWKAAWQLTNTAVPYAALWFLMIRSIQLGYSYLITFGLAIIAAAFLVRLFVLFHDCVHGSLFPKKGANTFFGTVLGMLLFTPFEDWRLSHLDGRYSGHLALLCAAPVRGCVLGAQAELDRLEGRHGRQFVLQTSVRTALVFRQHRVSSCPPPRTAHSELPAQRMLRCHSRLASQAAPLNPEKPFRHPAEDLG
jgi:hypothetical protein